ncbi:hypothetical protein EVAR_18143_1 [Eumeta japonica]|uniref:Uncharacterized protein n=1 Tax=Eumeta variegata TaxID=151549 RepID=A0A4C1UX45_EUMVA|nr:hypothetical protein EVAR_18143_1 [Eumeta japonica]
MSRTAPMLSSKDGRRRTSFTQIVSQISATTSERERGEREREREEREKKREKEKETDRIGVIERESERFYWRRGDKICILLTRESEMSRL